MSPPASNGPAYPLSREEFRRALATGHGRARIHVERFGAAEFRDEILEAATVCKVYDLQVNGARADWLADLCLAAGVEREVVALSPSEDPDDRKQRAALLLELAGRGVPGAREALYACWGPGQYSDFYATEEIVQLDGDAGLLFVARELGARVAQGGGNWISSYHLSLFDDLRGEGAGRTLLESAARSDANVRAYLDAVDADEENVKRIAELPREERQTTEQVLEAIRTNTQELGAGWVRGWGMRASRDELGTVLGEVLALAQPRALEAGLRCLGAAGLPPLHPRIFDLTRHEDERVRYWAARVLSHHSLPGVRACGLEALARGDTTVALEILTSSAQVDDADALVAALRPSDDPDEEHDAGYGILDLFKHSPEVRDARLALYVYERTPCSQCREAALCYLVRSQSAPAWVLEECAADASEDIRELAARTSKAPDPPPAVL
jgi:hypothetical protein